MDIIAMKPLNVVLFLLISASAEDVHQDSISGYIREALYVLEECASQDILMCLKERALGYLESLPHNLEITEGVRIKQNNESERISRRLYYPVLQEEPRTKENVLDGLLLEQISNYLTSHTIEIKVPEETIKEVKRSLEESRKKKKKMLGPLLLLFKLKAAAIAALTLKAIALVAFKALVIAKVALTIALIVGIKKLSDGKHTSTYEVVTHDGHGHFDRSFEQQELAYQGYEKLKPLNYN